MTGPAHPHTPGPWYAASGYDELAHYVRVCRDTEEGVHLIAELEHDHSDEGILEAEDNARLIAAAPELLERLQAILDWADFAMGNPAEFDSHGVRNLDGPVFDDARSALSKVLGEGGGADV